MASRAGSQIGVSVALGMEIDVVYKEQVTKSPLRGHGLRFVDVSTKEDLNYTQVNAPVANMLLYLAILACLLHAGHGLGAHRHRSPKFDVLYEPYKVAPKPQSTCYTYMTTVLITLPADRTTTCLDDAPSSGLPNDLGGKLQFLSLVSYSLPCN